LKIKEVTELRALIRATLEAEAPAGFWTGAFCVTEQLRSLSLSVYAALLSRAIQDEKRLEAVRILCQTDEVLQQIEVVE
jgi:hypothetical protein